MNAEQSKKINFVYEWIGPKGPLTNNRIPTLVDFVSSSLSVDFKKNGYQHDLIQTPHFYQRFKNDAILWSPSNLPDKSFFYELNFHNYHYRDILGSFKHNNGLLDNAVPSYTVVDRVLNKSAYVLITLLYEGYVSDTFFKSLTDYFSYKKVPLSQIVYVTNCQNVKEIYKDFCFRNNLREELNVEHFPTFRFDKSDIEQVITLSHSYNPGPRKKIFLCFNRRYNEHRLLIYLDFFRKGILNKTYMSMAKDQPESGRSFIENAKYFSEMHKCFNFSIEDIYDSSISLPLTLDTSNFSKYPMESGVNDVIDFYNDSYINIVTETYFFSNVRHITEKTYKPIAFMQPFIIFAAPGTLAYLRSLGFKTFDKFWDESYDDILDHEVRFMTIMELIEKISKWTEVKLVELTHNVKEIVEFNKKHLATMKDPEVEAFVNKYGV
jgi:hypothetical protein